MVDVEIIAANSGRRKTRFLAVGGLLFPGYPGVSNQLGRSASQCLETNDEYIGLSRRFRYTVIRIARALESCRRQVLRVPTIGRLIIRGIQDSGALCPEAIGNLFVLMRCCERDCARKDT
jgi:hypothetical protein